MNWINYDYDRVELHLNGGKITHVINLKHLKHPNDFAPEFKASNFPKIYLVKDNQSYKYVGATTQPIHIKLKQGLKSNGKNGYHGYKWKNLEKVEVMVWLLSGVDKTQMESIESELVLQIRNKYSKWPDYQNEIHFNNKFPFSKVVGETLFNYIERKYPIELNINNKIIINKLFEEPAQYGLRGDPFLWIDMKVRYETANIKTSKELEDFLLDVFRKNTGNLPVRSKNYRVKHFSFGGMSSGSVNSDFWIEKGIPTIINRFNKMKTTTNM